MPSSVVASLRAVAQRLAKELRPAPERLRVCELAQRLDVTMSSYEFQGPTRGVAIDGHSIVLSGRLSGHVRDLVFAHEVGHILLQRGLVHVNPIYDEIFADQFARELVLPATWLAGEFDRVRLMRRLRVPAELFALQLAAIGRAPGLQRLDTNVLCVDCGFRAHSFPCACHDWRAKTPAARQGLPDARASEAWRAQIEAEPRFVQEQLL